MVGDDIVQLAGDAHPLIEDGAAGVLLPVQLELDDRFGELVLLLAADPDSRR